MVLGQQPQDSASRPAWRSQRRPAGRVPALRARGGALPPGCARRPAHSPRLTPEVQLAVPHGVSVLSRLLDQLCRQFHHPAASRCRYHGPPAIPAASRPPAFPASLAPRRQATPIARGACARSSTSRPKQSKSHAPDLVPFGGSGGSRTCLGLWVLPWGVCGGGPLISGVCVRKLSKM